MAGKLQDKVAVITGAARGVGRCTALLMAQEGAKIVVADNGSSVDGSGGSLGPSEAVVDEIKSLGGEATAIACDVSDWNQSKQLIDSTIEKYGKLDILVNIAGNFRVNNIVNVTRDDWDALRKVHMDGMMHTSHFAALHWKERKEYGRLLNLTSDSFMSGVPDTFAYAAAKGAVVGMTRAIANAMVNYNVTAVIFYYGIFDGVEKTLADHGVQLIHLCTWWDVLAEAKARGAYDVDTLTAVESYLNDPAGWAPT